MKGSRWGLAQMAPPLVRVRLKGEVVGEECVTCRLKICLCEEVYLEYVMDIVGLHFGIVSLNCIYDSSSTYYDDFWR